MKAFSRGFRNYAEEIISFVLIPVIRAESKHEFFDHTCVDPEDEIPAALLLIVEGFGVDDAYDDWSPSNGPGWVDREHALGVEDVLKLQIELGVGRDVAIIDHDVKVGKGRVQAHLLRDRDGEVLPVEGGDLVVHVRHNHRDVGHARNTAGMVTNKINYHSGANFTMWTMMGRK